MQAGCKLASLQLVICSCSGNSLSFVPWVQVYELSAEVCAAARNMAELLKCLQQLVNNIHPNLCKQQQQYGNDSDCIDGSAAATSGSASSSTSSSSSNRNRSRQGSSTKDTGEGCLPAGTGLNRQVEAAAALLLYFVCVPANPVKQEVVKQLKVATNMRLPGSSHGTAHSNSDSSSQQVGACPGSQQRTKNGTNSGTMCMLQHPIYQLAVRAAIAVLNCNWLRFMRCYCEGKPHPLLRVVLHCHLQRQQVHVVQFVAAAYRIFPCSLMLKWLHLQPKQQASGNQQTDQQWQLQQLKDILQKASAGGCQGARVALEQWQNSVWDSNAAVLQMQLLFRG
eukprot:GHRR01014745.1.p1 GENE.GHRR01014745.1~~GHRR01014745.1.p1  ORF type:complete len:337 (+),score=148.37 GHRR01014745.1:2031-3041(+)